MINPFVVVLFGYVAIGEKRNGIQIKIKKINHKSILENIPIGSYNLTTPSIPLLSCTLTTYLNFGNTIKDMIIYKKDARAQNFDFYIEFGIKDLNRGKQSLYFVIDKTTNSRDSLFDYNTLTYFHMNCSPCHTQDGLFIFIGIINVFLMNVNLRQRAFIIKITRVGRIDNKTIKCQNSKIKNACFARFAMTVQGSTYLNTFMSISFDLRKKKMLGTNYLSLYNEDSNLFSKTYSLVKLVVFCNIETNQNPIVEAWGMTNIQLEPYQKLFLTNFDGIFTKYSLSMEIYFLTYGYSGKNGNLFLDKNSSEYYLAKFGADVYCNLLKNETQSVRDSLNCIQFPCKHGSITMRTSKFQKCLCSKYSKGDKCQHLIYHKNYTNKVCKAGNKCSSKCIPGRSGTYCNNVSCKNYKKCLHNSKCEKKGEKLSCICDTKLRTGDFCQFECRSQCINGNCAIRNKELYCVCMKGHRGSLCEIGPNFIIRIKGKSSIFFVPLLIIIPLSIFIIIFIFIFQIKLFPEIECNIFIDCPLGRHKKRKSPQDIYSGVCEYPNFVNKIDKNVFKKALLSQNIQNQFYFDFRRHTITKYTDNSCNNKDICSMCNNSDSNNFFDIFREPDQITDQTDERYLESDCEEKTYSFNNNLNDLPIGCVQENNDCNSRHFENVKKSNYNTIDNNNNKTQK